MIMIRQRVDIHGRVRQMEAIEDIPTLQLRPSEIGLLREAPARRWHDGQAIWDKRFKSSAKKVRKKRAKNKEEYAKIMDRAKELGLVRVNSKRSVKTNNSISMSGVGVIQEDRRWGPLDLEDESPPPSAIAARRDTVSALKVKVQFTSLTPCSA